MNKSITVILVLILAFLAACADKECSNPADCNDNLKCTRDICESGECKHSLIPNCFKGDGRCDASKGENKCTAPEDCGTCSNSKANFTYLKPICDSEDQCRLGADIAEVKMRSLSDKYTPRRGGPTLEYSLTYADPFNTDTSLLQLAITLISIPEGYSDVEITRIKVFEDNQNRHSTDMDIYTSHKHTYNLGQINSQVFIDMPIELDDTVLEKQSNLGVAIEFRYNEIVRGQKSVKNEEIEKKLSETVMLLNPQAVPSCPDTCDDNNKCTNDYCPKNKGYCLHEFKPGACCGNYICESGENACSCPTDCGSCEEKIATYTEYNCHDGECISRLKPTAIIKSVKKSDDNRINDYTLINRYEYNEPFDLREDTLKYSAEIASIGSDSGLHITNIQLLTDNEELIGEKRQDYDFKDEVGSRIETEIPVAFTLSESEESKDINIKVFYEYERASSTSQITSYYTYTYSIGNIEFVETDIE